MKEDVKQAAERLRRIYAGEEYFDVYGVRPTGFGNQQRDEAAVIAGFLAAFPADEGEAIDEQWIKSLGWTNESSLKKDFPRWRSSTSDRGGPTVCIVWEPMMGCDAWSLDGELIPPLRHRGDLRKLAAALGIPLETTA